MCLIDTRIYVTKSGAKTQGDVDAARQCYQQALTILIDLDHTDAQHLRTKLHQLNGPATDPAPSGQGH
jgi:hypothetical protein